MYDQGHARKYHMLCTHTLSGSPLIIPFHPLTIISFLIFHFLQLLVLLDY